MEPPSKRARTDSSTPFQDFAEVVDAVKHSAPAMSNMVHTLTYSSIKLGGVSFRLSSPPRTMANDILRYVLDLSIGELDCLLGTQWNEVHVQPLLVIALDWDPHDTFVRDATGAGVSTYTANTAVIALPQNVLRWGTAATSPPPVPATAAAAAAAAAPAAAGTNPPSLVSVVDAYKETRISMGKQIRHAHDRVLEMDVRFVISAMFAATPDFEYPSVTGKKPTFIGTDHDPNQGYNDKLRHVMENVERKDRATVKNLVTTIMRLADNEASDGGGPMPPPGQLVQLVLQAVIVCPRLVDWQDTSSALAAEAARTQIMLDYCHFRPPQTPLQLDSEYVFLEINEVRECTVVPQLRIATPGTLHNGGKTMRKPAFIVYAYSPTTITSRTVLLSHVGGCDTDEHRQFIADRRIPNGGACYVCRGGRATIDCQAHGCRRKICSGCLRDASIDPAAHTCVLCHLRAKHPLIEGVDDPVPRRMEEVGLSGHPRRAGPRNRRQYAPHTGAHIHGTHAVAAVGGGGASSYLGVRNSSGPPPSYGRKKVVAAIMEANAGLRKVVAMLTTGAQAMKAQLVAKDNRLEELLQASTHVTPSRQSDQPGLLELLAATRRDLVTSERRRAAAVQTCEALRLERAEDAARFAAELMSARLELPSRPPLPPGPPPPSPSRQVTAPAAATRLEIPSRPPLPPGPPPPSLLVTAPAAATTAGTAACPARAAAPEAGGGHDVAAAATTTKRRTRGKTKAKVVSATVSNRADDPTWHRAFSTPVGTNPRDRFRKIRFWTLSVDGNGYGVYERAGYPRFVAKPSRILGAGNGLFAMDDIPSGTKLGDITHHSPVNEGLPGYQMLKTMKGSPDSDYYDTSNAILGYCNDSRDQENQMIGPDGNEKRKTDASIFHANWDIPAGQELYYDYGAIYWKE